MPHPNYYHFANKFIHFSRLNISIGRLQLCVSFEWIQGEMWNAHLHFQRNANDFIRNECYLEKCKNDFKQNWNKFRHFVCKLINIVVKMMLSRTHYSTNITKKKHVRRIGASSFDIFACYYRWIVLSICHFWHCYCFCWVRFFVHKKNLMSLCVVFVWLSTFVRLRPKLR